MVSSRVQVVVKAMVVGAAVLLVGTLGYVFIEKMSFFDALYMTTITVTTIGFKEVVELSMEGRLFTMLMAFTGVGVILMVATELAHAVVDADLRRLFGMRRGMKMLKRLSDHIVVCGHGRMGRAVVETLRARNVPFVVVESRPERCRELEDDKVPVVLGDATKENVLLEAKVDRARTFIACLADDAHNVFAILLAKQLNPAITVIARAVEEESEERLHLAGADRVLNPYRIGGLQLALTALKPTVMDFLKTSLPGHQEELELAEIRVHPTSQLAGRTLAGAEVRQRFGLIVVALKRGEKSVFNPGPTERIEAGDVLVALGPLQAIEDFERAST